MNSPSPQTARGTKLDFGGGWRETRNIHPLPAPLFSKYSNIIDIEHTENTENTQYIQNILGEVGEKPETRLTYNCAHLRSTKGS